MPTNTTIVPAEVTQFLDALFAPADVVSIRPIESWIEETDKGPQNRSRVVYREMQHVPANTLAMPGTWQRLLGMAGREKANLFFGVCPRFLAGEQYDRAFQIRTVRALWADLDHCKPDTALDRCAKVLPKPSIVLNSGNGVHLYWLLDKPVFIDDVGDPPPVHKEFVADGNGKKKPREYIVIDDQRLYDLPAVGPKGQHIQAIIAGIAAKIDGDHTQDLSRILRLPCTMNRKDERNSKPPVPCELVECEPERRYPPSDFEKFAAVAKPTTSKPTSKRPSGSKLKKLADCIKACADTAIGERSQVDFALCCRAIELGIDLEAVWNEVQGVGKFAEKGREYFDRTWEKADAAIGQTIRNAWKDGKKVVPIHISEILATFRQATDDWPRRVGDCLFVHDNAIAWLESTAALFGYLGSKTGPVRWHKGTGCHSKEEVNAELRRTATPYVAVESMPHEPPCTGHYYACSIPASGDGKALTALVDRFHPQTLLDRDLIISLVVTAIWGGAPGARPCFTITSDEGRGVGKSELVAMLGLLVGGLIELSTNEPAEVIKQRLLSPEGLTKRIALLDNVKSLKFSWADLEALITMPVISGKRMYVGEGTRPNTLTWVITLNGVSLATDLAQRAVVIKVAKPKHSATWKEETIEFINQNRQAILADCIAFLRGPRQTLAKYSRWAAWEHDVLSRLPLPTDLQNLNLERQQVADTELEEHELVEEAFTRNLEQLGYLIQDRKVFIPSAIAARWYARATNEVNRTVTAVSRMLGQAIGEGKLKRLSRNHCNAYGKGFIWIGENATVETAIDTDLEAREDNRELARRRSG